MHHLPLSLPAFPSNKALCVFSHMEAYIDCTSTLRDDETKLFISYIKLHRQASRDTISRWIPETMTNTWVDTSTFKPHRTRSAATSKTKAVAVPIQDPLLEPSTDFAANWYKVKAGLLLLY